MFGHLWRVRLLTSTMTCNTEQREKKDIFCNSLSFPLLRNVEISHLEIKAVQLSKIHVTKMRETRHP